MTEPHPDTVADVLDAAADFIDEHGWHQGDLVACGDMDEWTPGMAVCAFGGILGVCDELGPTSSSSCRSRATAALEAMEKFVDYDGRIGDWNDDPARTHAEVTQALRDCAVKHRPDAMRVGGEQA